MAIGTTTTGDEGTEATVTNSGTASNPIFDFVIPRGNQGIKGEQGEQGEKGEDAVTDAAHFTSDHVKNSSNLFSGNRLLLKNEVQDVFDGFYLTPEGTISFNEPGFYQIFFTVNDILPDCKTHYTSPIFAEVGFRPEGSTNFLISGGKWLDKSKPDNLLGFGIFEVPDDSVNYELACKTKNFSFYENMPETSVPAINVLINQLDETEI